MTSQMTKMPPISFLSHVKTDITTYYNQLAQNYDSDRFGNIYGQFLHAQERALLTRWLALLKTGSVLDLGCGTGRFLDLATHGPDASTGMLEVARPPRGTNPGGR